jgi:hypothetical protein
VDDFDVRRPERKSDVMEVQPTDDALDHAESRCRPTCNRRVCAGRR